MAALALLLWPSTAHAYTDANLSADLETIQGDGSSIADYYNMVYAQDSTTCDAVCAQLGDQLTDTTAQAGGDSAEGEALGELGELTGDLGGTDIVASAVAAAPELAAAAAAGYLGYKIGNWLFGSPSTTDGSGSTDDPDANFYPAQQDYLGKGTCPGVATGLVCENVSVYSENSPYYTDLGYFLVYQSSYQTADFGNGAGGAADQAMLAAADLLNTHPGYVGGFITPLAEADYPQAWGPAQYGTPLSPWEVDLSANIPGGSDFSTPIALDNYTPELSTFDPTSGDPEPSVSPTTPQTGSSILAAINANPSDYQALIQQLAAAAAAAAGTQTDTDTDSDSDTDTTGTTGTATSTELQIPPITTAQTTSAYVNELQELGFTDVTTHTLEGDEIDLNDGPDQAVAVDPVAGTKIQSSQLVTVDTNPADAPAAGTASGSAPSGPTLPGIDVPSVSTPCSVFPFGIPCWIGNQLSTLNATPEAPDFSITAPAALGGGKLTVDLGDVFGINLDTVMSYARVIILFLVPIAMIIWLGGMAMNGSTSSSANSGAGDGD